MHTALGRLYALIETNPETPPDAVDPQQVREYALTMTARAAHYVLEPRLLALVDHEQSIMQSVNALIEAGIHDLPFDPILIEFARDDASIDMHCACWVRLQTTPLYPLNRYDEGSEPPEGSVYAYPLQLVRFGGKLDSEFLISLDPASPMFVTFDPRRDTPYKVVVPIVADDEEDTNSKNKLGHDIVNAMAAAMLMLNTRGVAREVVSTGQMNKVRAKTGKRPIGEYTTLKIGVIYDRHGREHVATGRHMPVHWRAGHVRQQPYGTGLTKIKQIYIQPCLVNFDPADGKTAPLPKHFVTV